jgi:hypothetical protein
MTTITFFNATLIDSLDKVDGLAVELQQYSVGEACLALLGRSWLIPISKARSPGIALKGCLHYLDRRRGSVKESRWFRYRLDDYGNKIEAGIALIEDAPHIYFAVNDSRLHLSPQQVERLAIALGRLDSGPDQRTTFDLLAPPDWGFPRDAGW